MRMSKALNSIVIAIATNLLMMMSMMILENNKLMANSLLDHFILLNVEKNTVSLIFLLISLSLCLIWSFKPFSYGGFIYHL